MITHDSASIPTLPARWDPQDRDWIWIGWASVLEGASISVSAWTVPAGWTSHSTLADQTVEDEDGTQHANANGVELSTTQIAGVHTIANKVTLSDGRILERSVLVHVASL